MSRVGKQPIEIPAEVQVRVEGSTVTIRGPKGELSRVFRPEIEIAKQGNVVTVTPKEKSLKAKAFWGLSRTLLANMIQGVTAGYAKKLQIEGVGYRAAVQGEVLQLHMGFSHAVEMKTPSHTKVSVDKNIITVEGINKEEVGQFAAKIRKVRPPEPYKGKGIRYEGEMVRRKLGKKAVGAGGTR